MRSQNILPVVLSVLAMLLGAALIPEILTSRTGGISGLIKFLGIGLAILAFIRPNWAVYIITTQFFVQDYLKKLAVYYGIASPQVLYEVMGAGFAALLMAACGALLLYSRQKDKSWMPLIILVVGALLALGAFAANHEYGTVSAGYRGASLGLPAVMASLILIVYRNEPRKVLKLLDYQFFLVFIWAVVGLKQVWWGFSEIEWHYARTWLSPVASNQMLLPEAAGLTPRPFGLGSGAPNFNVLAAYPLYGFWRAFSERGSLQPRATFGAKSWFIIASLTLLLVLILSRMKTAIALVPLSLAVFFIFRSNIRTLVAYVVGSISFVAIVIKSEWLINKIPKWDVFITSYFGREYSTQTFISRLRSFENLKDSDLYTFLGRNKNIHTHDSFSEFLNNYGLFGCGLLILIGGATIFYFHLSLNKIRKEDRGNYAFALTFLIPFAVVFAAIGRDSLSTAPENIRLWTGIGVLLLFAEKLKYSRRAGMESSEGLSKRHREDFRPSVAGRGKLRALSDRERPRPVQTLR